MVVVGVVDENIVDDPLIISVILGIISVVVEIIISVVENSLGVVVESMTVSLKRPFDSSVDSEVVASSSCNW